MAKKNVRIGILAGLGVLALTGIPGTVEAQAPNVPFGWQPFLGCWQPDAGEEDQGMLCFAAVDGQIEMLTIAGGAITHREPFLADGLMRQIEQEGCSGAESARFSNDYRRIYTVSNIACQGQSPTRGTGIIFMASASEWVDVRTMQAEGEETRAWSQWYVRTDERGLNALGVQSGRDRGLRAAQSAMAFATAPITMEDVIDATDNVDEKAVEAWIAEVNQMFVGLDSEDLIELDDAGVSGDIIDVVVAVSFMYLPLPIWCSVECGIRQKFCPSVYLA